VELQQIVEGLARAGTALFAISYDAPSTLAAFAAKHGITYPLLGDEGSRVIRQLGMLDEDLDRHHAEFGRQVRDDQRGVAYPAVFLLDRNGIVAAKRFLPNYRVRDTGAGLIESLLGVEAARHGPEAAAPGDVVNLRAYFDAPVYRPYQQLRLTVELAVAPGWHVYVPPVPDGYTALSLSLAPIDGVSAGPISISPSGHPARVEGLDELFTVVDGAVRARIPVTFAVQAGTGDLHPEITVRYQACSDTECRPPAAARLTLSLREAPFAE
jgi:peroxiredoxin